MTDDARGHRAARRVHTSPRRRPTWSIASRRTDPARSCGPKRSITASVTEGVPPLTVQFGSAAGGRVQWDFGDGATSARAERRRTSSQKPGLYSVDADRHRRRRRQRAQSLTRSPWTATSSEPIVRAGFARRRDARAETPRHGQARRATARCTCPTARLGAGCRRATRPIEDLRGLRSFTILGWLKPESLQTGSGGNRIVFCLNHDHSGIDLVCHADGRLRLAVNQWPDGSPERQFARQTAGRQMDLLRRHLRRDAVAATT